MIKAGYSTRPHSGFTLVELSIVLVVLGLLVGGILAGKSLIRASELRSVSRDFERYTTAVHAFRDKYFYLPGDIPNATRFWGAADGDDGFDAAGNPCSEAIADIATCNGDGNGYINNMYGTETMRFWQHLANATLIEGKFTGAYDTTGGYFPWNLSSLNTPASKLSGAVIVVPVVNTNIGFYHNGGTQLKFNGQLFLIGKLITADAFGPTAAPLNGALSHEDAWNIDAKMDDGNAANGKVRADLVKNTDIITNMTCVTYSLSNTTDTCVLGFIFGQ